jgi:hypothetical protein
MPAYNVYHVVPRDDQWVARLQGSPTVSATTESREEAIGEAERIVRQLGAGRIVVHGADGAIERVHTFDQITGGRERSWTDGLLSAPVLLGMAAVCLIGVGFALRGRRQ